jgi:two-component system response regulator AgrA
MLRSIQNHNLQKINTGSQNQKLQIKNGASISSIFINDISYIEKIGYETYIHLNNKSTKCCRLSLDSLEKELAGSDFIRCHRAYIINKSRIRELSMKEKSVVLDNGEICPIGGKYKQELLENCISEQMILGNTPAR